MNDNAPTPSVDNDDNVSDEIINDAQFEDMRELLEEDFYDLVQTYLLDSEQRLVKLRVAAQNNDNSNGFEIAHALKGASLNLGATQLAALSHRLERSCRAHKLSEQNTLLNDITVALEHVKIDINQRLGTQ